MAAVETVHIGTDAITGMRRFCHARFPDRRMVVVADRNTEAAAGNTVVEALEADGLRVSRILLGGDHIHADEVSLARVLARSPYDSSLFIAAGSGTITDITRYISFRLGMPFISVPTAASVDGYASIGSPLVIEGVKRTHYGQVPLGIFADPSVLSAAPPELTAAGVGDMLGKITSSADWRLGRLLWDEPFDPEIAARSLGAAQICIDNIEQIAARSEAGMVSLMQAVIESGRCMIDFGESRPASGAEHHISHLWEMHGLASGVDTSLHGAQVGVAVTMTAGIYARLRQCGRDDARAAVDGVHYPDRQAQETEIRSAYGAISDTIIGDHEAFLALSPDDQRALAMRAVDRWDEVQAIAADVPEPGFFVDILRRVGGPTTAEELGLRPEHTQTGVRFGHYLRERFTVAKLARLLGL